MQMENSPMTRIAVFYDGSYFSEISNFYRYQHERKARINFTGFHDFIAAEVAGMKKNDPTNCKIVEKHYFRGRFSTESSIQRNCLDKDRLFDDVLLREGIVPHYLPMDESSGTPRERGVDVSLAIEAIDLAWHKAFEVLALVACDGDYVPLVRKLSSKGIQTLLVACDFSYERNGREKVTRTSQPLIAECSYAVMMHDEVDSRSRRHDQLIRNLFMNGSHRYRSGTEFRRTIVASPI